MPGIAADIGVARALAVELDAQPQVIDRIGVAQRVFVTDLLGIEQLEQGLVEGLHAHLARPPHHILDLGELAFEDLIGDQRRVDHDLHRGHAPLAGLQRHQPLRHQRAQIERQVHQQLRAPFFGEEVDDAVERLVGIVGVQRGQHQVAGLGEHHRVLHGLAVADFAHQNDVGRLTQGVLERRLPAVGVQPDFTLGHDAVLVRMHELDGVFHRDDVAVRIFVAEIEHGGHRGRFTRACGADKNDEPALVHRQRLEHLRQSQAVDGGQVLRDLPQHDAHLALLDEGIAAKAREARGRNREIAFLGALELGRLFVVHDRARQRQGVLAGERLRRQLGDCAIDLDGRRKVGREKQVRAAPADHQLEQIVDEFGSLITIHTPPSACSDFETVVHAASRAHQPPGEVAATRALSLRRRSDKRRASEPMRRQAAAGSCAIMRSRSPASSTAISLSVSVVQYDQRGAASTSDISPSMLPARTSVRRSLSPQGCMRSTATAPRSSTTMKLPVSPCAMRSAPALTV